MTQTISHATTSTSVCIVQLARRNKLIRSIEENNFNLAPTPADKIHNRSGAVIVGALKKQYNRSNLAKSIREFAGPLKHVQTTDRSAPFIDLDVHIKFSERRAFLHMLLTQVENFYIRVLEAVVHVSHTSVDTAKYVIDNAPIKANELLEKGRVMAHDAVEISHATQLKAQEGISDLLEKGRVIAHDAAEVTHTTQVKAQEGITEAVKNGKEAAATAKGRASLVSSLIKETADEVADALRETATIISSTVTSAAEEVRRALTIKPRHKLSRSATEEASIYAAYAELLRDVERNRQDCLNHVLLSEIKDRSKPFIPSSEAIMQNKKSAEAYPFHARRMVLTEIKRSATLKTLNHVSMRDCSAPVLPTSDVKCLASNPRKQLLSELRSTSMEDLLVPAGSVSDRSAPMLPESVDLSKGNAMKLLLTELKQGVDLAHAAEVKDRSAPFLEAGPCAM